MGNMHFTILVLFSFQINTLVHGEYFGINNDHINITYDVTFHNRCQTEVNRLRLYQDISISDCVIECGMRNHCETLNYYERMNVCELFTASGTEVSKNGCFHIKRQDINVTKSPCDTECDVGRSCDVATRECVFKECTEFPQVPNGVILGNSKNIGHKIITKCNRNYVNKDNVRQSYCMEDGQWKPEVECIIDCGELTVPTGTIIQQLNGTTNGSVIIYTCETGLALTGGHLTRTCQANGIWSGEEPSCGTNYCSDLRICYLVIANKDLYGYDLGSFSVTSFDQCSNLCDNSWPHFKAIVYCVPPVDWGSNCYCKSINDLESAEPLTDHICSVYRRL